MPAERYALTLGLRRGGRGRLGRSGRCCRCVVRLPILAVDHIICGANEHAVKDQEFVCADSMRTRRMDPHLQARRGKARRSLPGGKRARTITWHPASERRGDVRRIPRTCCTGRRGFPNHKRASRTRADAPRSTTGVQLFQALPPRAPCTLRAQTRARLDGAQGRPTRPRGP